MKNTHAILSFSLLLFAACNQDPIFHNISNEVKPKDPLINGSPSKLVERGGSLYVANGRLWRYSGGGWTRVDGSPSNIYDIAGGSTLYLLQVRGSETAVYSWNDTEAVRLDNPTGYSMIQGLYGEGGSVVAGAMRPGSDDYAVLTVSGNSLSLLRTIPYPLTGVSGSYYATSGGIFSGSSGTSISGSYRDIAGIISAGGSKGVIAVTSGGWILEVSGGSVQAHSTSVSFTGALAVYGPKNLLLLGIKGSIYDLGYREMRLNDNNWTLYTPGDLAPDSSVADRDKYRATLGQHAVSSLRYYDNILFASTQKDGLWSYRGNEWNAEE
jgi:hypothetical protein